MTRILVLVFTGIACATVPAYAQTSVASPTVVTAAEQLANDTQQFTSDIKAGASAATLTADGAKISADLTADAATLGISNATVPVGKTKYVVNLNMGIGGSANTAFPSKTGGVSVAVGGGGSFVIDLGVGLKTDGSDHWHILLANGVTSLTATSGNGSASVTSSVGAYTLSLMPAYLPTANALEYGLGPILACPLVNTPAITTKCVVGLQFTTALSWLVKQISG